MFDRFSYLKEFYLTSAALNFRDPATVYAHSLISLHHDIMWFLILVMLVVF